MSSIGFTGKQTYRRCFICGHDTDIQKHHITPRSAGGDDSVKNIKWLCESCHNKVEGLGWSGIAKLKQEIKEQTFDAKKVEKKPKTRFKLKDGSTVEWSPEWHQYRRWTNVKWGIQSEPYIPTIHGV